MTTIAEKMEELSTMYISKFQEGKLGLDFLCKSEFTLGSMNMIYRKAVRSEQIQPIEDIPAEMKNKLWDDAKALCPEAYKEKTIELCKAIWVINSILEK